MGGGRIKSLDDLRAPMAVILGHISKQVALAEKYRAKYGPLESSEDEGSDTEQE